MVLPFFWPAGSLFVEVAGFVPFLKVFVHDNFSSIQVGTVTIFVDSVVDFHGIRDLFSSYFFAIRLYVFSGNPDASNTFVLYFEV